MAESKKVRWSNQVFNRVYCRIIKDPGQIWTSVPYITVARALSTEVPDQRWLTECCLSTSHFRGEHSVLATTHPRQVEMTLTSCKIEMLSSHSKWHHGLNVPAIAWNLHTVPYTYASQLTRLAQNFHTATVGAQNAYSEYAHNSQHTISHQFRQPQLQCFHLQLLLSSST